MKAKLNTNRQTLMRTDNNFAHERTVSSRPSLLPSKACGGGYLANMMSGFHLG